MSMIILFSLVGCRTKNSRESSEKLEKEVLDMMDEERVEAAIVEFKELASRKESDIPSLIGIIDENLEELDKENVDTLILEIEDIMIQNLEVEYKIMDEKNLREDLDVLLGDKIFLVEEDIQKSHEDIGEFISRLDKSYYKLMKVEDLEIVVDYDKFLKYGEYMSEEIDDYFSIQALKINQPILHNGNLNISHSDIPKRLLKMESYLRKYEHEKRYERVLRHYKDELVIYLQGTRNTPLTDEEGRFKKEVLDSYKNIAKNKEDITSYIGRAYMEKISENGQIMNEEVKRSVVSLVSEGIYYLEDNRK